MDSWSILEARSHSWSSHVKCGLKSVLGLYLNWMMAVQGGGLNFTINYCWAFGVTWTDVIYLVSFYFLVHPYEMPTSNLNHLLNHAFKSNDSCLGMLLHWVCIDNPPSHVFMELIFWSLEQFSFYLCPLLSSRVSHAHWSLYSKAIFFKWSGKKPHHPLQELVCGNTVKRTMGKLPE